MAFLEAPCLALVGVLTMFLGFNGTRKEQIFLMLLFRVPFLLWECQPLKHRYLLHHKTDSRPFAYVVSEYVLTIFSYFLYSYALASGALQT